MKTNATCTLLQQSTHYLIHCLSVSFSLSLFLHVWWSTQGWGATFSERDCTDVNDILLVLSATSYTSPWEGTGSIDRRAGVKSRTGILQSGSQTLTALSARNSSPKHQHLLVREKQFLKKDSIKSLFSHGEQNLSVCVNCYSEGKQMSANECKSNYELRFSGKKWLIPVSAKLQFLECS